jgi:hypothetical protein
VPRLNQDGGWDSGRNFRPGEPPEMFFILVVTLFSSDMNDFSKISTVHMYSGELDLATAKWPG